MNAHSLLRTFNEVAGRAVPSLSAHIARRLMLRPRRRAARVVSDGQRIHFRFGLAGRRWGDVGPAVLMVHGWEGSSTQFRALVDPLVAAGRQVFALDAPAHGDSPGEEATLMEFVSAIQEAAVELPLLESVVGHSLGAAAAAIALDRGLDADRAVLVSSPASIEATLRAFAGELALPREASDRFVRLVEQANGMPARELDIAKLAPSQHVAALIVHDRDDRSVPFADAEAIARAWPGARLLATRGLGHARLLSDPGVVAAITSFLAPEGAVARPRTRLALG